MTKIEKIALAITGILGLILVALVLIAGQGIEQTAGGFYSANYGPAYSIGTSSPVANFQVANASTTATSTLELGASGRAKGSCLKMYRTDGSAIYAYVAAGATSLTLTTTACATITGF